MQKTRQTDVIVIGAGPVGMFTALCLRSHNLEVEIFDTLPRPSTHSYALALHPESLSLFQKYGLLDRLTDRANLLRQIWLRSGREKLASVDLATAGLSYPYIAVLGQQVLESVLQAALLDAGVKVHWNHRVSSVENSRRGVHARVSEIEERTLGYAIGHSEQFVRREHDYEAAFIIGTDGHDSFLRRFLEIDFPEVAPPQRFAVFECKGNGDDADVLQLFPRETDATVRWPLGKNIWRWSFQVGKEFLSIAEERRKDPAYVQLPERSAALDVGHLQDLINERAPGCPASVEHLYWRLLVGFQKRLADRFGEGRMWLAGDAAHLAGPVGNQSMNVGLREAHDLANRIASVIDLRASGEILDQYGSERIQEWRFLLGLTGGLRPKAEMDERLAALAKPLVEWLPASGYNLASLVHRLGFEVEGAPMATGEMSDPHPAT
jgi:2-polyprenyl-6-methoxyphenol hydroxylase-like FAD-dependent oxidoreductase